jgi:hypothetical protein
MDNIGKTFKNIKKGLFPKKTRKTLRNKLPHNKSSSNSIKLPASKLSASKLSASKKKYSPKTLRLNKSIKKIQKSLIDIDVLVKDVDRLQQQSKQNFSKKKTKRTSPIIVTVRNLDTGNISNATVIKDLNTGKYELYKLSNSK